MAYFPTQPRAGQDVADWVHQELRRISGELRTLETPQIILSPQAAAPAKPRAGMVAFADGTNWNPGGTGAGLYQYSLGGAWVKL